MYLSAAPFSGLFPIGISGCLSELCAWPFLLECLPPYTHLEVDDRFRGNLIIMLAIIGLLLIALWIAGLLLHIAGGLIHFLLVVALILVVLHFVTGTRPAA